MLEITGFSLFAFIMYAHSQQWWDDSLPTVINRIITVLFLSIFTITLFVSNGYNYDNYTGLFLLISYALWICPGHMSYISNALGENPKVPRWVGLLQETAREALGLPLVAGLCYGAHHAYWPCIGFLFMGLPYYINGYLLHYIAKGKYYGYSVGSGQAMTGMIMWGMIASIL